MNKTDRLAALICAYIQRQANPDRVGCPPAQWLEALSGGQLQPEAESWLHDHLWHCRECLLELRVFHHLGRQKLPPADPRNR